MIDDADYIFNMSAESRLIRVLTALGERLGFAVEKEVEASESAFVDIVWFDSKLSPKKYGQGRVRARHMPILPVVGFEIEIATGANAKHVKGSVSNLNNLAPSLGVIVIGEQSFSSYQKRLKPSPKAGPRLVEGNLLKRAYRWIFAESQPKGRVVLMTEKEVYVWAGQFGIE